jgi:hypothetical protein
MFVAPFTAVGFFNLAANRRASGARSGAYPHIRKLHGLTGELTVWPAIADFDIAVARLLGLAMHRYATHSTVF